MVLCSKCGVISRHITTRVCPLLTCWLSRVCCYLPVMLCLLSLNSCLLTLVEMLRIGYADLAVSLARVRVIAMHLVNALSVLI